MIDLKQQILDTQSVYRAGMAHSVKSTADRRLEQIVRQYLADADTQREAMAKGEPMKVSTALMCLLESARQ